MTETFKLNQRAELLDESAEDFAFILEVTTPNDWYAADFKIVESKYKNIYGNLINFNEWKIYNIRTQNYFGRIKIYCQCEDPAKTVYDIETGGRSVEHSPEDIFYFFQRWILDIIFKLSFCENFEDLDKVSNMLSQHSVIVNYEYKSIHFSTTL